jgi:hypothetical protein
MLSRAHMSDTKNSPLARLPNANQDYAAHECALCLKESTVDLSRVDLLLLTFEQSCLNQGLILNALPKELRVFWRCNKENHLIYESVAQLERQGWQCSSCLRQTVTYLCDLHELAGQMISIEGTIKNPAYIRCSSLSKATWRCPKGADHIWTTPVYARARLKSGCPFCANRRVSTTNSLSNFPEVAVELHPLKNRNLTAESIIAFRTTLLLWWRCSICHHEWQDTPSNRTRGGRGCPQCRHNTAQQEGQQHEFQKRGVRNRRSVPIDHTESNVCSMQIGSSNSVKGRKAASSR